MAAKPDFSKLSDEQLEQIASGKASASAFQAPTKSGPDMSWLNDDELEQVAAGQAKVQDFISSKTGKRMPSVGQTLKANLEDSVLFGGRAGVAGVGEAIGQAIYDTQNEGLPSSLSVLGQ